MKHFLFVIIMLSVHLAEAQKRANVWYFGTNAGLDFNAGAPVVLTNGQINTYEGVASICDDAGALQFYTDGANIWDRTHTLMPNGTGMMGGSSSSQAALIVPWPGNDSLYYVFATTDGGGGFWYSVVNMNLNGGNGDVDPSAKNIMLLSSVTEKLTGAVAQNGVDIWVVVHQWMTNGFYAYRVTPTGIDTPVVTSIGLVHDPVPNQIGCMKISHDAKKIAVAVTYMSSAELLDFDNATGIISNPVTFTGLEDPYGVEFSPDNSKLYFASRAPYVTKALYQYDLNAGSDSAIIASKTYVYQSAANANNGTLQLAPDGKIYLTSDGSNFLEVINNPNNPAVTCGHVLNGFDLSPQSSQQGLPNFITTWFSAVQVENTCLGDSTQFIMSATGGLLGAQWNFDDPASGAANAAYIYNPAHLFTAAGNYQVQLISFFSNGAIDTSYIDVTISAPPQFILGPDSSFCNGDTFMLSAPGGFTSYLWQNGSSDSSYAASAAGIFWVTVSQNSCKATDSISLATISCSAPSIGFYASDSLFCEKKCIDFFDISTNSPTSWQWLFPGSDSLTSNEQNPTGICYNSYGTFDVTLIACNVAGCDTLVATGLIVEYLPPAPVLTLSNDTLYSTSGFSYQWYNTVSGIITGATGNYYVTTFGQSYYVIITDSLGCPGASAIFAVTDIEHLHETDPVLIFPNPNSGTFTVSVNEVNSTFHLFIYNSMGQLVYKNFSIASGITVDIGKVRAGMYFIETHSGGKIERQRFIVQE